MNQKTNLSIIMNTYGPLLFSISLSLAIYFLHYSTITEWDLGDNDNFMRLHQIMTFIESPSWYLRPLKDFNPQDGKIIHWSRIPDLPILAFYYISLIFVDHISALQFSIAVVPLIYLIIFSYLLCLLAQDLLRIKQNILTIIYTFFSIAATKFYPGYIDHHNLQILIFAYFIWLSFSQNVSNNVYTYGGSISIAASLLIGLEVLPFFIITLALTSIHALYYDLEKLKNIRKLSVLVFVFGVCGILIFQPASVWLNPQYDIVNLPLLCFFLASSFSLSLTLFKPNLTILLITMLAFSGFTWIVFPDALKSPYSEYPSQLVTHWLNNVSEAKPILKIVGESTDVSQYWIYLVTIIPAGFSFFLLKTKMQKLYYCLFITSVMPAIFWQVRTITISSTLAIPLQILLALYLFNKVRFQAVRIILPLMIVPIVSTIFITILEIEIYSNNNEKQIVENQSIHEFIKSRDIKGQKILASIDHGAKIVALTGNSIVTAPYHRNIQGNLLYIEVMQSNNHYLSYEKIKNNKIDFLIFDKNDKIDRGLINKSNPNSIINLLMKGEPPQWLHFISEDSNGKVLYQVEGNLKYGY